jgi:hypothetical protein
MAAWPSCTPLGLLARGAYGADAAFDCIGFILGHKGRGTPAESQKDGRGPPMRQPID